MNGLSTLTENWRIKNDRRNTRRRLLRPRFDFGRDIGCVCNVYRAEIKNNKRKEYTMKNNLTEEQKLAITCAYCDLIGSKQARDLGSIESHNWSAHKLTAKELEKLFPFVLK